MERPISYRLQGHEVVPSDELATWTDINARRVAQTTLPDGTWISTVFLAYDHQWGDGSPLLFETEVFPTDRTPTPLDCERYSTWDEAEAGHAAMVAKWTASEVR